MNVRLSTCGVMFYDSGKLVWDDYLEHQQFALTEGAERIVRWFVDWRPLNSVRQLTHDQELADQYEQTARQFLDRNILVAADSRRDQQERKLQDSWRTWGVLAPAFHYSTRTSAEAPLLPKEEADERLLNQLDEVSGLSAYKSFPGAPRVQLPKWDGVHWQERDLVSVLRQRRSRRKFGAAPIPLDSVAALLQIVGGTLGIDTATQSIFKASPSAGGLHPTEIYIYAQNIADLAPGVYHYHGFEHVLERIDSEHAPSELVYACADQKWVANAALFMFYTSIVERNQWKYDSERSYRILHYDVGHLSQTAYLLATALGLRTTFTAALRDGTVEDFLGCDPSEELVMGCSVVGTGD